jgi:hypothetical protein
MVEQYAGKRRGEFDTIPPVQPCGRKIVAESLLFAMSPL